MTQHSNASALASGDTWAWLDSLGVDERESFSIERPEGGAMVLIAARLGVTAIGIDHEGAVMIHVHGSVDEARTCFRSNVENMRNRTVQINAIRAMAESDPRGALAQLAKLMGAEDVPNGASAPLSLPTLASDQGTGYYL